MKKTEFFELRMKSGNQGKMVITYLFAFHCRFSLLLGKAFKKIMGKDSAGVVQINTRSCTYHRKLGNRMCSLM